MRMPHTFAVAVRRPDGEIAITEDVLLRPQEKFRWLGYPVLRGLAVLVQSVAVGMRALRFSAEQALEGMPGERGKKKTEFRGWMLWLNVAFSLAFFIFFYKFVPLYLATLVKRNYDWAGNLVIFNLLDGLIRLALFVSLLWLLAQWKEIQRLFEYHGAEHKVVWAFEQGDPVDVSTARVCSRFHPRCGTSFMLVVLFIALVVYLFLPFESFLAKFVSRLLLLPLIAGVSYEFIRLAAKTRGKLWRVAARPGLWLQRITTREPDDSQLETAIRALKTAMQGERSRGGELVIA